jgi:hypothetical protein
MKIRAIKPRSGRELVRFSVDLDHQGFLYFSFVVCCEWVMARGVFLPSSYLNVWTNMTPGTNKPGRGNADSEPIDAQAAQANTHEV